MADSKRHSLGGTKTVAQKTAPPKGPTGLGELDYSQILGARCKITTVTPSVTIEGTIFTVCPITNVFAISTSSIANSTGSKAADYKLIPISRIQNFAVIPKSERSPSATAPSASAAFENAQPSIARIDFKALQAREVAAIKKIKEKDASRGKDVTKEAQGIFDGLLRTLPTRWDGQNIIVNDAVNIAPPYTTNECRAAKGQQLALERVKLVLEDVRKKLALKPKDENKSPAAATPPKSEPKASGIRIPSMIATPLPRKGG